MRSNQIRFKPFFIVFIPIVLLLSCWLLAQSSYFFENANVLSLAISIDFLLTIPIIYFLLIRKTSIPKTTIVPMMILGLIIGFYALPENQHYYLNIFKTWLLPIVEISIVTFVLYKVFKVVRLHKTQQKTTSDFFDALKKTCTELLPKPVVVPFAMEVAVFYYGFIAWKRKKLTANEFSYHKKSGVLSLYFALILLVAIEIVPIHFLLAKWSEIAAWILTLLSVYSGIQIFGYAKSLTKRPIVIEEDVVKVRYGIMQEAIIPINVIDEIQLSTKEFDKDSGIERLSILGELESHNVLIKVSEPQLLHGLFGRKKKFEALALSVDSAVEFKEMVEKLSDTGKIN